ncbi:hypothetical protein ACMD2_06323 [Ananas comosus]|uniref:Uncharacterized protein n=1 Tax=Ananas comosus TaxID=4615 RepID=A0A199W0T7_ANACO|nr:hypothetical protein ACMD2_06323 [Ananas comosus]
MNTKYLEGLSSSVLASMREREKRERKRMMREVMGKEEDPSMMLKYMEILFNPCITRLNVECDAAGHGIGGRIVVVVVVVVAVVVRRVVVVPPVPGRVVLLAVAPEGVGLLAVHGVVADGELVLGHAEREEQADDEADDGRHDDVPADDEQRARDLLEELHAADAAVEGAAGVGHGEEEVAEDGLGEEARGGAAEEAGHGVGVEDAERVVHLLQQTAALVDDHHREPRDAARQHAHHDRRPPLHQT